MIVCILYKNCIDFLIYYYIIYNIADTKNRWPEDRPRLLLSGRASFQGAALLDEIRAKEVAAE